ncbi:unnamed protein product [Protopolystoma xenopodis]|uniref:Uncharacterized protein n=1 Tax=Protopolystoma xenopodis TaxID=117903 RepID=A0A448WXZ1_9PLAT|nr:unnamed protein product [Protopolystoma xenopodis]
MLQFRILDGVCSSIIDLASIPAVFFEASFSLKDNKVWSAVVPTTSSHTFRPDKSGILHHMPTTGSIWLEHSTFRRHIPSELRQKQFSQFHACHERLTQCLDTVELEIVKQVIIRRLYLH